MELFKRVGHLIPVKADRSPGHAVVRIDGNPAFNWIGGAGSAQIHYDGSPHDADADLIEEGIENVRAVIAGIEP
ncbi:hypothetical protein D3C73_1525940 [compost metagenome]